MSAPHLSLDAPPLLVADIGGTHARFALAHTGQDGAFTITDAQTLRVADHAGLDDAAAVYLAAKPVQPQAACLAVAGPVNGDVIVLTNSGWRVDADALAQRLALKHVLAVNDFAAMARGAALATPGERQALLDGVADPAAPSVVLGPGTGLGVALLTPGAAPGAPPQVFATEGGHAPFAPHDALEAEIWRRLHDRSGYVAWEHVLSGPGISAIYAALAAIAGRAGDALSPAEITAAARAGQPLARRTIVMFSAMLGAFAGGLVVLTGARGGVHVGGGVLARLGALFDGDIFRRRFGEKGVMSGYTADIPVWRLTSDTVAFAGAAALAHDAGLNGNL